MVKVQGFRFDLLARWSCVSYSKNITLPCTQPPPPVPAISSRRRLVRRLPGYHSDVFTASLQPAINTSFRLITMYTPHHPPRPPFRRCYRFFIFIPATPRFFFSFDRDRRENIGGNAPTKMTVTHICRQYNTKRRETKIINVRLFDTNAMTHFTKHDEFACRMRACTLQSHVRFAQNIIHLYY